MDSKPASLVTVPNLYRGRSESRNNPLVAKYLQDEQIHVKFILENALWGESKNRFPGSKILGRPRRKTALSGQLLGIPLEARRTPTIDESFEARSRREVGFDPAPVKLGDLSDASGHINKLDLLMIFSTKPSSHLSAGLAGRSGCMIYPKYNVFAF